MKNSKYYPLMLVLICILVFTGMIYAQPTQNVEDQNIAGLQRPYGPKISRCQTASTSPTFANTTASSSCIFDVSTVDSGTLNIITTASTSDTTGFVFSKYFTFDDDDDTNRNWFPEKGSTSTSGNNVKTYGSNPLTNILPGDSTVSSTNHSIFIPDIRAKFMKIDFGPTGGNGSFYLELVK